MTIIQRLPQAVAQLSKWFKPISRKFVAGPTEQQIDERGKRAFCSAVIVGTVIGLSLPLTAWTADLSPRVQVKSEAIVAAGIGYENAESSKLTVKTYDAESGAILTDETFDLDVREDAVHAVNGRLRPITVPTITTLQNALFPRSSICCSVGTTTNLREIGLNHLLN